MKINKASPVATSLQYTRNFANLEVGGLMTVEMVESNKEHDVTHIKYLNVLHHNKIQKIRH